MVERLSDKQARFTDMVCQLIEDISLWKGIDGTRYRVRFGHAERCKDCPIGMANSLHKQRLAIDLIIDKYDPKTKTWQYLRKTQDYSLAGEIWEEMGGSWGGRFNDGNHFSLAHGGRK